MKLRLVFIGRFSLWAACLIGLVGCVALNRPLGPNEKGVPELYFDNGILIEK